MSLQFAPAHTDPRTLPLRGHIESFKDPATAPILADALAEALRSPDLDDARTGFAAAQREPFRQALARAVERGELPADLDYELTMDLLIAPIVNRALATRGRLEPALAERIVDIVLGGIRAFDASSKGILPADRGIRQPQDPGGGQAPAPPHRATCVPRPTDVAAAGADAQRPPAVPQRRKPRAS